MDPWRKLKVVSAANPSLRVTAAPQNLSVQVDKPNAQVRVEAPKQAQLRVDAGGAKPADRYEFPSFYLNNTKNKTIFGKNAAWMLPKSLEKTSTFNLGKNIASDQSAFVDQFSKLDDETKGYYVEAITKKAQSGDQAAKNAYVALRDAGKFKGNLMNFIEGSNEKLGGGILREGLRVADYLLPGKNTLGLENQANKWDASGRQYTDAARWGKTFGTIQKGAVDIALLATGASAAEKAALKIPAMAKIATTAPNASRVAKTIAYGAKILPGSAAGTGIDILQTAGRGDKPNIGKSVAIGTAVDLATPAILKPVSKLYKGIRGAINPAYKAVDSATTKYLAKETNPEAVKSVMSDMFGVPANDLDAAAQQIVGSTTSRGVRKVLNSFIDTYTPTSLRGAGTANEGIAREMAKVEDQDVIKQMVDLAHPELSESSRWSLSAKIAGEKDANNISKLLDAADEINASKGAKPIETAPTGTVQTPQKTPIPTPQGKVPVGTPSGTAAIRDLVKTKEGADAALADLNDQLTKVDLSTPDGVAKAAEIKQTIIDLSGIKDELPLESAIVASQAGKDVTLDQAGKQLSGVAPTQVDNAVTDATQATSKAATAANAATEPSVAPIVSSNEANVAQNVSNEAAYRSAHQIDTTQSTAASDLTNLDELTQQIKQKYGLTNFDRADLKKLTKLQNNPDAEVTIYRASPTKGLNGGDWVTTSKDYADDIARNNGGKVYSYKVKAKELLLPNDIENNPSLARFSAFAYQPEQVVGDEAAKIAAGQPLTHLDTPEIIAARGQGQTQSILNTGNPGTEPVDVAQRGFARSLGKAEVPQDVYENLLGYTSRPNAETFAKAEADIAANEQGVLQDILTKPSGALTDDETARALLLLDNSIANGNLEMAQQLAGKINVSGTENGRAVQILAAVKKTTPAGAMRESQKIITEAQEKGLLPKDYVIPKEQLDGIMAQAKYIQDVKAAITDVESELTKVAPGSAEYDNLTKQLSDGQREYELSVALLGKGMQELVPPTIGAKLNSAVNIALLLNPKTFVRNIFGNSANAVAETVSSALATPLDVLASLRTGNRTTSLPSIIKRLGGAGRGLKEGAQETELGIRIGGGGKYDINPAVFKNKLAARIEKTLGHSLSDLDKSFATAQYEDTLNSLMKSNGVNTPTQEMMDIAYQEGLYATFQQNSFISNSLQSAKKWLNQANIKGFGLGDIVVRYPKTPGNIVSVGLDYSPYGFAKGLIQFAKLNEKAGLAAQREAVRNLGRGIVGSGLIAGGYYLAKNNIITAKKSSDLDVASLQRNQGQPPFSFNISALKRLLKGEDTAPQAGDVVSTYDWLQPNAIQLSMGANMALNTGKGGDWISTTLDQAASGLETIEEQPVLSQVGTFFKTAATPAERGGGIPIAIKNAVAGTPSMFVPSVLNQAGAAQDNTARTSYDPNIIKQSWNKVVGKLPFANRTLEPVVDSFGNEVKRNQSNNPVTRIFNSFVNPAFVTKLKTTPEGKMVFDIYNNTDEKTQFPRVAARQMTINGEKLKLSGKQLTDFQKYTGTKTQEAFAQLADNPSFMALSDEDKASAMTKIVTDISSAARIEILGNTPKNVPDAVKSIVNGKTLDYISKVPEGVNDIAKSYYSKTAYMDEATYKEWLNGEPDEVAQSVASDLNSKRPAGVQELTAYNGLAKRYAEFEKAKTEAQKDGTWTKIDEIKKTTAFWKGAVKDGQPAIVRDLYDNGTTDLENYMKQGWITKTDLDAAIALDDQLYSSDLSNTLKFSKTFRRKYGYGIPVNPSVASSGGGSGGRGGKAKKRVTGVNNLKLKYTAQEAPTFTAVPSTRAKLQFKKPSDVQVTPVRIKL